MTRETLTIDPVYSPPENPGRFDAWLLRLIRDPRDLPFLHLCIKQTLTVLPFAIALFIPGLFRWWLAPLYLGLMLYFLGPFILMLHATSHRPLFKKEYKAGNHYIPWVLGPFFGETPDTYYAHHIGMHHPENNLPDDLSTTMPYQRDSFLSFLRYHINFMVKGFPLLMHYHYSRGRTKLGRRVMVGELVFYAVAVALLFVNWQASMVVFIIPFFLTRFLMMSGNWAQHAFVDAGDPGNPYRNSLTCINSAYNRRCFNDGYHIGHHIKATRHWTEMPVDFEKNLDRYAKEDAVVLTGTDFHQVWFYLMFKRYDRLADKFVHLGDKPKSRDEVLALLKQRTRRIETSAAVPAPA